MSTDQKAERERRQVIRDAVKAKATRSALAGKRLSPVMVNAVTAKFAEYADPDGSNIQVGTATVAQALGTDHASVGRVRTYLLDHGFAHFESAARKGHKAVWWHLALPDEPCPICTSPEPEAQEDSPEPHSRASLLSPRGSQPVRPLTSRQSVLSLTRTTSVIHRPTTTPSAMTGPQEVGRSLLTSTPPRTREAS